MARLSRVVVPGRPHHVTQRGVRSVRIFSGDHDRREYLRLLAEHGAARGLKFLAWCLMSNHVHLIVVPERGNSLARGLGEAHKTYTRMRNLRQGVTGYLFQGRFGSCVLDEPHLQTALRYVEQSPVRARIVKDPWRYKWSSAGYHAGRRRRDPLCEGERFGYAAGEWRAVLRERLGRSEIERVERHVSSGRPLAEEAFVKRLERRLKRPLLPRKGGWPKGKPRGKRKKKHSD